MAEQCLPSPRNGLSCALPYTEEAHQAGHRTAADVPRSDESHWATLSVERRAMQQELVHE